MLTAIYSDNLTPNVTFTYNRLGQQLTVADAVGSRTFNYDSKFQLTGEAITGLYSKTINRSYAATGVVGRYTGLSIGTEYALSFDYDTYGRMGSLTNGADTFTYSYLANSDLLSGMTYPNTITVTNSYEATRDLITSVENKYGVTTISKYDYVNNAISNRTSMAKSGTAFTQADTISYAYNDRSEVTAATALNDLNYNYAYQFDNIGNRLTATEAGNSKTYTANQLNQYTAITNPAQDPTYDDDGNMLNDGTWTFTWDAENRMKSATNGTQTLEFTYDYLSRRVERKVYSGLTLNTYERFVYNNFKAIEKLDALDSNTIKQSFVWSGEKLLSLVDSNGTYYYLQDANKNIGQLIDSAGTIKANYEYSPFGKLTVANDTVANPFRFSSEYFDSETGLVYYNYRYYSPDLGRWLSRDPIEEEGGYNLYCMVANNPVNLVDLLGLVCPTARELTVEEFDKLSDKEKLEYVEKLRKQQRESQQAALDALGVLDPTPTTDFINATIYGKNGEYGDALISMASMFPYLGDFPKVLRHSSKIGKAADALEAMARGSKSEKRVLDALGETKNTKKVYGNDGTASVPDYINNKTIGEIKDTKYVSNTKQLRAQREAATREGKTHEVQTGVNTKVSKNVKSEVKYRDDLGPK